jgi:hypothetical protein
MESFDIEKTRKALQGGQGNSAKVACMLMTGGRPPERPVKNGESI